MKQPSQQEKQRSPFRLALILPTGIVAALLYVDIALKDAPVIHTPTPIAQSVPVAPQKDYVVSKFKLVVLKAPPYDVSIKLDTDAPDELMVSLSAYRTYRGKYQSSGEVTEFSTNYFDEKVTVGELKRGVTRDLDEAKWQRDFDVEQRKTALHKLFPNTVSQNVTFLAIVPKNARLTGPAVKKPFDNVKVLQAEQQMTFPLYTYLESPKPAKREGVSIGMSTDEVLSSNWGKPQHKNVTHTAYGTTEQWVYRSGNYLYFTNGTLTAIQTH